MEKTVISKGRCTYGMKDYKVAEQVSLMKTAWAIQPLHKCQAMLNELILWFKRTDRSLSSIQLISGTSAVDLHISSSMRTSYIKKFAEDRCQRSLQMTHAENTHAISAVI
jgi:hypothetical protein